MFRLSMMLPVRHLLLHLHSVFGALVAEKAKAAGITAVVFDRNGYLYHGRVKALADGARNAGLNF